MLKALRTLFKIWQLADKIIIHNFNYAVVFKGSIVTLMEATKEDMAKKKLEMQQAIWRDYGLGGSYHEVSFMQLDDTVYQVFGMGSNKGEVIDDFSKQINAIRFIK